MSVAYWIWDFVCGIIIWVMACWVVDKAFRAFL